MMDKDELMKRVNIANDEFLSDEEPGQVSPPPIPVDMYQQGQDLALQVARKDYPRGSNPLVHATVRDVINGNGSTSLQKEYSIAKEEYDKLRQQGSFARAEVIANQYNQERLIPAIELVVNMTSPDELLNSRQALASLDSYVIGVGEKTGYTGSYVRTAYRDLLGQRESSSDPVVQRVVEQIHGLCDTDQIRSAQGVARRIKEKIDKGENIASEGDYQLISRLGGGIITV